MNSVTEAPSRQGIVPIRLIHEINREHSEANAAGNKALKHAIACGERLIKAKATLPHGEWQKWLAEHFQASIRTARVYMTLAANRDAIDSKEQSSAVLSIESALQFLRDDRDSAAEESSIPEDWKPFTLPDDASCLPRVIESGFHYMAIPEAAGLENVMVEFYEEGTPGYWRIRAWMGERGVGTRRPISTPSDDFPRRLFAGYLPADVREALTADSWRRTPMAEIAHLFEEDDPA